MELTACVFMSSKIVENIQNLQKNGILSILVKQKDLCKKCAENYGTFDNTALKSGESGELQRTDRPYCT